MAIANIADLSSVVNNLDMNNELSEVNLDDIPAENTAGGDCLSFIDNMQADRANLINKISNIDINNPDVSSLNQQLLDIHATQTQVNTKFYMTSSVLKKMASNVNELVRPQ